MRKRILCLALAVLLSMGLLSSCASKEDKAAAQEVNVLISDIGNVTLSESCAGRIARAREAFDALPANRQKLVSLKKTLEEAEQTYNELKGADDEEKITNAEGALADARAAQPDKVGKETVENAIRTFQALPEDLQERVNDADVEALKTGFDQKVASTAEEMITALEITDDLEKANQNVSDVRAVLDLLFDSENEKTLVKNFSEYSEKIRQMNEAEEKAKIQEAQNTVRIHRLWCSAPDSAGGVEVYIHYTNTSSKTIKYFTFGVNLLNGVGDVISSGVGINGNVQYCRDDGPIAPGAKSGGSGFYWGKYYDYSIKSLRLVSVDVEYMDGTKVHIWPEQCPYLFY